MAKGDSAMLLTQGTILVDVSWWDRYWGWKLPASFSPMLEKKLLTRFDFSLSSTASDPSSLFNEPIAFLNLGLFAFESRFQYSAAVLTSANRSLKCLALALRISAVISFLSFLYAAYLLGCFVRFASLNNLSLRFILGLIVLLIHGADVLLTFTSLNTNVFISHKDPNYLSVMLNSRRWTNCQPSLRQTSFH